MERLFRLRELGATSRTEVLAGVTTFLTMAYIIFLNPVILSGAGMEETGAEFMDFGAVMVATCLAAALASIFMGLVANYPIALAPGMGENAVFAAFVGAGLITWPAIKVAAGKGREVPVLIYIVAALFIARYALIHLT